MKRIAHSIEMIEIQDDNFSWVLVEKLSDITQCWDHKLTVKAVHKPQLPSIGMCGYSYIKVADPQL